MSASAAASDGYPGSSRASSPPIRYANCAIDHEHSDSGTDGCCQYWWPRADHCTRCDVRFDVDATRYVVWERIVVAVYGDSGFYLWNCRWVSVCVACLRPCEQRPGYFRSTAFTCLGCGAPLVRPWKASYCYRGSETAQDAVCSDRCYRRARRAYRQATRPRQRCLVCEEWFRPERSDSRYCSPACRQRAYRQRRHAADCEPAA
jgi:hypothetical protein